MARNQGGINQRDGLRPVNLQVEGLGKIEALCQPVLFVSDFVPLVVPFALVE